MENTDYVPDRIGRYKQKVRDTHPFMTIAQGVCAGIATACAGLLLFASIVNYNPNSEVGKKTEYEKLNEAHQLLKQTDPNDHQTLRGIEMVIKSLETGKPSN